MSPGRHPNIALLIDADNATPASIDPVLVVLAELGTVNIRRAYANWAKGLTSWSSTLHAHGIAPVQQFDLTTRKNATDMALLIDAMDLLHGGKVDGFGIMSSDSDFTPLVLRLRQDGLPVYGFGESKTPKPFQDACTRFIDVTALRERAAAEAVALPEAPAGAPAPEGVSPGPQPVPDELLALLIEAYNAVPHDEQGYAALSALGSNINARSSFDARTYGHRSLSKLFEALPNFTTTRRDNHLYVKRVR